MKNDILFNTLMIFTDQKSINLRSFRDAADVYVRQCLGLARSLDDCGTSLRIFTNDAGNFRTIASRLPRADRVRHELVQLDFPRAFPEEIPFYAGHHKIFLFNHFASEGHRNCLLDSDVLANRSCLGLLKIIVENPLIAGWVYDISDQVFPGYGTEIVQGDLHALGAAHPFPRWYGGEFLLGDRRFFSMLDRGCQTLLPRYLGLWRKTHHVGDELLVSVVLNDLPEDYSIADVGASGLILRHWTGRTKHTQKSRRALRKTFLWHLPDSKPLLASFYHNGQIDKVYRKLGWIGAAKGVVQTPRALWRSFGQSLRRS